MDVRHPLNQIIASILMGVMFLNPIVTRAAELTLDAAAGGNASLGQAANGVPLVNIATPNGSGLSHNKFTDYNVGQQGLILNNSAQALAPTQLGGYIVGNPNLAGGAAGLILNEVTGSNASRLEGYTEVAGQVAHVIVANPHGITCDGCGFINTPRATLTTGTPQIENGGLKGYDVNGGSIAIEGAGLNAGNVGQFELITRAAEINAEIHAQQLTIVTGRNEVDAQTLAATAKADDGSTKPSVAIDSSALGGMYAGAIRLVGTEAGVGVKLAGDLAASGGDIRIDANGQLTMARSAAAGNLAIKAQDVTLQNDTFAAGSGSIETNQLTVQESLAAGHRVDISAQTLNNPGTLEAGVRADGSLNASAQLQLSGDAVNNSGKLISHGSLTTDLKTLTNPGEIAVTGNAQIKAESLANSGQLIVQQNLAVEAAQTHIQGTLGAAGSVRIDSTTLTNESGLLFSGADMTLRSEGITNRLADILSLGALDIALDDQNGRSAYLENISGTIESAGDMRLAVDQLLNRKERFAATQRRVEGKLILTGTDNCKGDHCEAAYLLQERYEPQISEDSTAPMLVAGGDLSFVGERFENRLGSVSVGGKIRIDADQFFNIGAGGGRERTSDYYIYTSSDAAYWTFINNMGQYNAYNDPNSPSYNPEAMSFESIALGVQRGGGWVDTSGDALVNAVVQAGGAVEINASQTLENAVIRPDGSGGAHLNRQLPPDLAQRLVDPLALPGFGLPAGSGLFRLNNDPGHRYLIESNPAFASLGGFLSSDYMLDLLGYTADTTQRRLGDGLYEQRLIREAIIARTGKRFLVDALATDEAQFRYLMENAVASKEALNLSVGISLSAEQVAALTHDIVWMEEREVSGAKVLVPVLYLAQANDRLAPTGALIQGSDLALISGGGLHNSGTLRAPTIDMQAMSIANRGLAQADRLSLLAMGDVRNSQGGILKGDSVEVSSLFGDVINERSVATNSGRNGGFTWRDDVVDSAARIEAGSELLIDAGRDLRNTGGVIQSGGDAGLYAGRDIRLEAATETDSRQMLFKRAAMSNRQVTQHGGEVDIAGNLDAWAGRDLTVVASQVKAQGDIDLYANRDLTLAAAANERESDFFRKSSSKKVTTSSMAIEQQGASVAAGGALSLGAGSDLALIGSRVQTGGDAYLYAGRDVALLEAQDFQSDYYFKKKTGGLFGTSKQELNESRSSTALTSSIASEGNLVVLAQSDIVGQGARLLSEGDIYLNAGNDVVLAAATSTWDDARSDSKSKLLSSKATSQRSGGSAVHGTRLDGRNVLVSAGNDLRLQAAGVRADEEIVLQAGRDIDISTAERSQYSGQESKSSSLKWNFDSLAFGSITHEGSGKAAESSFTEEMGSTLSGNSIVLRSGRDTSIRGSTLVADADIFVDAGRNLNISSGERKDTSNAKSSSRKSGEIGSWWQGATGIVSVKQENESNATRQLGSQLVSFGGNIDLEAGERYRQQASQVIAVEGDVRVVAKRVDIEAGYDLLNATQTQKYSRTAVGGEVSIPVLDAVRGVERMVDAYDDVSDERMKTLAAVTAAMKLKTAYEGAQALANGDITGIKISINLSDSRSTNQSIQKGQNVVSSAISAGRDISIVATGANDSDINVVGSSLGAQRDIHLQADRHISLMAAENTAEQTGKSKGGGWSIGIGFGFGGTQNGFTLDLAANQFQGKSDGSDNLWTNTQVQAGRQVNLESGQDTSLKGSVVRGEQVTAKVGGGLTLESLQDTSTYRSKQSSSSAGISLCIPPFCYGATSGGASSTSQKSSYDYASVVEQTAIYTGSGGFQISVVGDTRVRGAAILSNEAAVHSGANTLSTRTLRVAEIGNQVAGKASSNGFSLNSDLYNQGKYGIFKGLVENEIDRGSAKDAYSGVTYSAISAGQVIISDVEAQLEETGQTVEQALARLRRTDEGIHAPVVLFNIAELERQAEAERIIKGAVYDYAIQFSDDAYRTMFLKEHAMFEIVRDAMGGVAIDEHGEPMVRKISEAEKMNLKAAGDGRIKVFFNGIFNDEEAAKKYATQIAPGQKDIVYLVAFPETDSGLAELMVAGYQKFFENDFWGLSKSVKEARDLMLLYGATGFDPLGHSRGSMTIGNAMESLLRAGLNGVLSDTVVRFFGPAYNAEKAAGLLFELSDGRQDVVYLQNHADDYVGSFIGQNPATYHSVPEGSTKVGEWINMSRKSPTTHSCYGNASEKCVNSYGWPVTWEIKGR